jgi:hypothetical protein
MASLTKLDEIDRELESFGKGDELLGAVLRDARAAAPQGLDAIDAALAELGVAIPPRARTVPPEGARARPATWERPARSEPPPEDGSGLVEVPEEVLRAEALPAVLELPEASSAPREADRFDDSTDVRDPSSLEDELFGGDEPATGETGLEDASPSEQRASATTREDRPLADLFDDAPSVEAAADGSGGLADLFDDEDLSRPEAEPAAHEDLSDLLSPELQSELAADGLASLEEEPERTAIFTSEEVRAIRSSAAPPRAEERALDAQLDHLVGDALSEPIEPAEMPMSGDFELMIDEDVLVLDDDGEVADDEVAGEHASPDAPQGSPSQPPPKGFFSRILNRK